jgi:hypothetical protein
MSVDIAPRCMRALAECARTTAEADFKIVNFFHAHDLMIEMSSSSLMWLLAEEGATVRLRWWVDRYERHSDWLWPLHVHRSEYESGQHLIIRFIESKNIVELAVDGTCIQPELYDPEHEYKRWVHESAVPILRAAADRWKREGLPTLRRLIEAHMIPDLAAIVMRMLAPPSAKEIHAEMYGHAKSEAVQNA